MVNGRDTQQPDHIDATMSPPSWRRAHPLWVLFYSFGLATMLSMTAPIRPELMIDLACIAQPPSTPSTLTTVANTTWSQHSRNSLASSSISNLQSQAPSPFPDIDTDGCKRDVKVQKLSAHIQMGIKLIGGLMSVLAIGYWATLSDRIGRLRVVAVYEFGVLVNEAAFLLVIMCPQIMACAGVSVLFVGPFIEGMLGAFPAASAASSGYITDSASEGSRFAYFAAINGFLMVGNMVGPLLGSITVKLTNDL